MTPDMTPDTTRRITAVPDMTRRITAAPDTTRRITATPDTTRRITAVLDTTRRITVVLDPPRTGLAPSVCKALRAESAIDRIVFVSCNPHGHTLRHDYVVKGGSLAANTRPTPRYFASAVGARGPLFSAVPSLSISSPTRRTSSCACASRGLGQALLGRSGGELRISVRISVRISGGEPRARPPQLRSRGSRLGCEACPDSCFLGIFVQNLRT